MCDRDISNNQAQEQNPSQEQNPKDLSNNNVGTINAFGQMPMPEKPKNPRGNIHCLTIIGQIEGHMLLPPHNKTTKYEHVIPQLVAINDNAEIDGMLVILNTVGGDVEAGLAIAELIAEMNKPTVSLVLGGGHSIGVPLAVSADYTFIASTATMTIHPVRLSGTVIGVSQTYDYMDKMQDRIIAFTKSHSRITAKRFKGLMTDTTLLARDIGTILIGKEAVDEKIIDAVGGLGDAMEKLYQMIEKERKNKADQER